MSDQTCPWSSTSSAAPVLRSQLHSEPPNMDIEQREKWYDNLKPSGVYYEGFLDAGKQIG